MTVYYLIDGDEIGGLVEALKSRSPLKVLKYMNHIEDNQVADLDEDYEDVKVKVIKALTGAEEAVSNTFPPTKDIVSNGDKHYG